VIATCLSLVGIVKFAKPSQQSKLFVVLVVELVTICVGVFADLLQVNPRETQRGVERPLVAATHSAKQQVKDAGSKLQEEVLAGLKPDAADLASKLLQQAQGRGIELRLIAGYRSPEQQADLVSRGVSKAKISTPNSELAFDVVVVVVEGGVAVFDAKKYEPVGAIGKALGLVWGGDFKPFSDLTHFETKDARDALQKLRGA